MLGTPITAGLFCPWCHATKDSTVIWHPYLDFCRQATRSTLTARGNLHTRTHCISFLLFHIQELDFFHTFQPLSLLFLCDSTETGWNVPQFVWLCWSRLPTKRVCVCVCVLFTCVRGINTAGCDVSVTCSEEEVVQGSVRTQPWLLLLWTKNICLHTFEYFSYWFACLFKANLWLFFRFTEKSQMEKT